MYKIHVIVREKNYIEKLLLKIWAIFWYSNIYTFLLIYFFINLAVALITTINNLELAMSKICMQDETIMVSSTTMKWDMTISVPSMSNKVTSTANTIVVCCHSSWQRGHFFPIHAHSPPNFYPQTPWKFMDPGLRHSASSDSCHCFQFYSISREMEWGSGQLSAQICVRPSRAMVSAEPHPHPSGLPCHCQWAQRLNTVTSKGSFCVSSLLSPARESLWKYYQNPISSRMYLLFPMMSFSKIRKCSPNILYVYLPKPYMLCLHFP